MRNHEMNLNKPEFLSNIPSKSQSLTVHTVKNNKFKTFFPNPNLKHPALQTIRFEKKLKQT